MRKWQRILAINVGTLAVGIIPFAVYSSTVSDFWLHNPWFSAVAIGIGVGLIASNIIIWQLER